MSIVRLFVYGSLQRGCSNHAHLSHAVWRGLARTAPHYRLADVGAYPALLSVGSTVVHGELYDVDAATLAVVDDLEGHPTLYQRRPVELEATRMEAQAYFLTNPALYRLVTIPCGNWRQHRSHAAACPATGSPTQFDAVSAPRAGRCAGGAKESRTRIDADS